MSNTRKQQDLRKLIGTLRTSPGVVVIGSQLTYNNHVYYFEGLLRGLMISTDHNFERQISKWYQKNAAIKAPNMIWFCQFDLIHKDKTEAQKIKLLLDDLELFFEEVGYDLLSDKKE